MARIPIIKLNNGTTSYYPLCTAESTVTTRSLEVKNSIGSYKKGDTIPAVTTFDEILTNLFENEGTDIAIDNKTIVKNSDGQLEVNKDEILSDANCDQVNTTIGTTIKSIKQVNGKVFADVRSISKTDIPVIDVEQVNGLGERLYQLEKPLTKESIPDITTNQVIGLDTKLASPVTLDRIPQLPINKVEGLEEALEIPLVKDWSPWRLEGDTEECTRIFWDDDQWKYKNDSGELIEFDHGYPSKLDRDACELSFESGDVFKRVKQDAAIITDVALKQKLCYDNTHVYDELSYPKSVIGRIKNIEDVKFSNSDSITIGNKEDVLNTIKLLLVKFGMNPDAIAIDSDALDTDPSEPTT